jgi:hypothetical protein
VGEDALLTIREAADMLSLSIGHVRNHLDEFFPQRIQYGPRTVRIKLSDVLKLIAERSKGPPREVREADLVRLLSEADDGPAP